MVAVFQAGLKLVREEAGAQLSNMDNNCTTSQGSNHLHGRRMLQKESIHYFRDEMIGSFMMMMQFQKADITE